MAVLINFSMQKGSYEKHFVDSTTFGGPGPGKNRAALDNVAAQLYSGATKLRWAKGVSESDVQRISRSVALTAYERNLDPGVLMSQIYQESRFDKYARSRAGALGVSQIMPRTAKSHGLRDPRVIEDAVKVQGKIMASSIEKNVREGFGSGYREALMRYNAGGPRFRKRQRAGTQVKETAEYPGRIMKWRKKAGYSEAKFPEFTYSGGDLPAVTVTALHPERDPGLLSKADATFVKNAIRRRSR